MRLCNVGVESHTSSADAGGSHFDEDMVSLELIWLGGRVFLCDAVLSALEDGNGRHAVFLDRHFGRRWKRSCLDISWCC